MNIALIGFMGTGKTSVGLELARVLNWDFVDTDRVIEQEMGMGIPEIFSVFGEERFRLLEKRIVADVANKDRQIISTGGGVVLNKKNICNLHQSSVIICLKASPQTIFSRIIQNDSRPLIGKDPLKDINKMLEIREPYYQCADLYIDTSEKTIKTIVEQIVDELSERRVQDVRIKQS